MEELPRIVLGGARLILPKYLVAYIDATEDSSSQDEPPDQNSIDKKPSARKHFSGGRDTESTSIRKVLSFTTNTLRGNNRTSGTKSPQGLKCQIQFPSVIERFVPKSATVRILYLIFWPVTLFYFFCIYLPMELWKYIQSLHVYKVSVEISLRKNELIRRMAIHLAALSATASTIVENIRNTTPSEALQWLLQTWLDILTVCNNHHDESVKVGGLQHNLSLADVSELLAYEELEDAQEKNLSRHVMRKVMHNYIPCNPFKATVKIPSALSKSRLRTPISAQDRSLMSEGQADAYSIFDKYSPASFPSTPFSRANVMHRTEEKTDTVMFTARDILRMEVLSSSGDEHSHEVAGAFLNSGQMAVFDPNQTSEGVVLSCGNHCAEKIGKGLYSSSRTMIPVPINRFVYMEFSIQATNSTNPSVSLGLSPPDCPLNVSVGSWTNSVGLCSELHLTVASRLFDCLLKSTKHVAAGSNIGLLVYIPNSAPSTAQNKSEQSHVNDIPSAVALDDDVDKSSAFSRAFSYVVQVMSPGNVGGTSNSQGAASQVCDNTPGEKNISSKRLHDIDSDSSADTQLQQMSSNAVTESTCGFPAIVQFNIDGTPVHFEGSHESIQDITYMNAPLYPTVSIMSEGTKIWCRMSEADQIYRSRAAIGAPCGVKVYCLDGSVLIGDSDYD